MCLCVIDLFITKGLLMALLKSQRELIAAHKETQKKLDDAILSKKAATLDKQLHVPNEVRVCFLWYFIKHTVYICI